LGDRCKPLFAGKLFRPTKNCETEELVPRRDVEANGFHQNIQANVMFAAWLDRMPSRDLSAREIIHFILLLG